MPYKPRHATPIASEAHRPTKPVGTPQRRQYDHQHRKNSEAVRKLFPLCQFKGERCTGFSQEAHHKRYGVNLGLADYVACCKNCHVELEREKRSGGSSDG